MDNQSIISRFRAVQDSRSQVEDVWDYIERYISPYRGRFFKDERRESSIQWRKPWVYDATAIMAAQNLASSLHSRLTSASTQWFGLRFRDEELNNDTEAMAWLEDSAKRVFEALQDSNFNLEVSETYQYLVCFGTSVIFEEETTFEGKKQVNFKSIPIKEAFFEEDEQKRILRFYRHLQWTPAQIKEYFKENVPSEILEECKNPQAVNKKYDIIFCIYPRNYDDQVAYLDKNLSPKNRPFGYKYVLLNSGETLGEEGGYYEMPAFVPRWRTTSSSMWGNSPAMIALSDTLTLNRTIELNLTAVEKAIDPPTLTTSRGLIGDLDLAAGGLTVVRDVQELSTFESKSRFDVVYEEMNRLRQNIESYFFIPQLILPPMEGTPATATEIAARMQQLEGVISPTLGRLQKDLLDPIIQRTFKILSRNNLLKQPPAIIGGAEADIEYTSPMARTQDSSQVQAIERFAQTIMALSEGRPELANIPNWTEMMIELGIKLGVSPKNINNKDEIEAKNRKQEQMQNEMAEGQTMQAMGDGIASINQAGQSEG